MKQMELSVNLRLPQHYRSHILDEIIEIQLVKMDGEEGSG